ncbi:PTS sugar transporter subunit IIA [Vallicoccus soli]|uniref:PTS sugar transporter subunit IIA n=1 Tax=Vallicoccus soli TaxID=2339232 RepID=A0A3A3Z9I8_9ACTN|nr:PTS sugar transporter subunit IIA [Vallicoccus soli]RJK97746.1 PTS sugar transporter subunit IIA [Vallicoccus soli]
MSSTAVVPELSVVRPRTATAPELLALMARRAHAAGWVGDGFEAALLAREVAFPTGLPTPVPVALPHADPEHVRRPGLGAALLDPPVAFGEMGTTGERTVAVRLALVLLVDDPAQQVPLLARLVGVLQRPDWADGLEDVHDAAGLAERLNGLLGAVPAP